MRSGDGSRAVNTKKISESECETRVAYEVSVSKLELLEEAQVQESIV